VLTLLAPRRTPAVTPPSDNGNSNTGISTYTSTGFQSLPNSAYISYIRALCPDIAIALADTPYGNKPGGKRIPKMADRTYRWVSELISGLKSEKNASAIFAPILPIDPRHQFEYLDELESLSPNLSGLAFYSSDLLPDIPAAASVASLPRLSLDEPSSPQQILRQVSLGMDLFAVPFISMATDAGIALTFKFGSTNDQESSEGSVGVSPLGIDMWSPVHATSLKPFVSGCTCYGCRLHHRAFVQHLLNAKEMLGWVLLQIHNHHTMSEFFASIRSSIQAGTFEADYEAFERRYESELPEKTGVGPRLRGYHYRAEGPGETKKNKPAWGTFGGGGAREGAPSRAGALGSEAAPVPEGDAQELIDKGFAEKTDSIDA
jgi:queuine tRNA-ribosyltransferase subunit QTRTD1